MLSNKIIYLQLSTATKCTERGSKLPKCVKRRFLRAASPRERDRVLARDHWSLVIDTACRTIKDV